jgi:hypothetical protein
MTENPYSPPKAHVADVPHSSSNNETRPTSVMWALRLLWTGLGLGMMNMAFATWRAPGLQLSLSFLAGVGVAFCAVAALAIWIILQIRAGRNWARILILVFCLLSVPSFITRLGPALRNSILEGMMHMLVNGSYFLAVALLFLGSSSAWFRKMRLPSHVA